MKARSVSKSRTASGTIVGPNGVRGGLAQGAAAGSASGVRGDEGSEFRVGAFLLRVTWRIPEAAAV